MLVELSVVEQRYHAVMEVLSARAPVVEVAARYGVSRKTVHAWVRRYREEGLAGLADRSHRPHRHPWQLDEQIEALICEMRRNHPRWGPRRLGHELARTGLTPPSRSSIYRTLVRNNLIVPTSRRRARGDYQRWERPEPMQLWQLDIMGSVWITDPTAQGGAREVKLVTGIDDHSRFVVIATVVERATSRAVCRAFCDAMTRYGPPEQVLTDNGRQFTGRFARPRRVEVLFDRICRRNGIDHLLTKVRSPTTTGKIERWHHSIQAELLDDHGPFDSLDAAQAAIEHWVDDYNHHRPHQARAMTSPATHFPTAQQRPDPAPRIWSPPELTGLPEPDDHDPLPDDPDDLSETPTPDPPTEQPAPVPIPVPSPPVVPVPTAAVEIERVVPASGNLGVCGQQFWLGTALTGRIATLWIDTTTVHLSFDGIHHKTVPSRMTTTHLARLRAEGARPAGPAPVLPAADRAHPGPLQIHRTANYTGGVSVAGTHLNVGAQHAGRRVTIHLEDGLAHVIVDGVRTRTTTLELTPAQRRKLRGAHAAGPLPAPDDRPARTQRRVSSQGATQVINQRVLVGQRYAGQLVTIEIGETTLTVYDEHAHHVITQIPRTSTQPLTRFKAYGVRNRTTG